MPLGTFLCGHRNNGEDFRLEGRPGPFAGSRAVRPEIWELSLLTFAAFLRCILSLFPSEGLSVGGRSCHSPSLSASPLGPVTCVPAGSWRKPPLPPSLAPPATLDAESHASETGPAGGQSLCSSQCFLQTKTHNDNKTTAHEHAHHATALRP